GAARAAVRNKARVSLVVFRARWWQTKWTRVEETAIRDHCLEAGWDHLMFVKLEKAETPTWVPESYLYLDYQAFGISDLIGAVKAKCAKLGVELKAPTAADRAARDAAKEKLDAETEQMLRGSAQPLYDAAESVFDALERLLSDIEQRTGWTIVRGKGQ